MHSAARSANERTTPFISVIHFMRYIVWSASQVISRDASPPILPIISKSFHFKKLFSNDTTSEVKSNHS